MTGSIRQGIAFVLAGLLLWLLTAGGDGEVAELVGGSGLLVALVGAILVIAALLKPQRD